MTIEPGADKDMRSQSTPRINGGSSIMLFSSNKDFERLALITFGAAHPLPNHHAGLKPIYFQILRQLYCALGGGHMAYFSHLNSTPLIQIAKTLTGGTKQANWAQLNKCLAIQKSAKTRLVSASSIEIG